MLRLKIIFILLLISIYTSAQQLHVENYSPSNGLLDTRVIKIFQDKRGLIYFLTWEGISIFDGKHFENISEYGGESLGLVNDMIQWKDDTCYVFTFQKGAYKLIHNRLIKDTGLNKILELNQVLRLNKNNWVITSNIGLFHWDGRYCKPFIQPVGKTENGIDYAAIQNGYLVYLEHEGKKMKLLNLASHAIVDSIKGYKIYNITAAEQGGIFVNIDGTWMQLNRELLQQGKLKTGPLYFTSQLPPGFKINNLLVTEEQVWVQDLRKGFILFNTRNGQTESYPRSIGINSNASIIFKDMEDNLWISIFSKQVQKAYHTKLKNTYQPAVPVVINLINDEDSNVIAWSGRQLYMLQNSATTVGHNNAVINSFYWQGLSWIFKTPSLIQSNRGDMIDLSKSTKGDAGSLHTYSISFDRLGRLLICGNSFYVIEKNLRIHSITLPYFTDNIAVDNENTYWAFARGGMITAYKLKEDLLQQTAAVTPVKNISARFAIHWNADTFCIGTRHHGVLWVKIDKGNAVETGRINTAKGLSNNFASGLSKINNRKLYAATAFGLDEIIINDIDTTAQNLGASANLYLPFSHVIKNSKGQVFARSNDDRLWVVTDNNVTKNSFEPSVWFNEITVNGKATDESLTDFRFTENNFRFTVAAPCFINAGSIRYHFLFENQDNIWQQQSTENNFSINNLSPGKYNMTVTVLYPGKIYRDKKISYSFIINAPFWKRWWFIGLIILLAALIFWVSIRAYYKRKLTAQKNEAEKQQAVEKERNRISRDMHDDLGSGLTKIAILSEVAKKQLAEPVKAKEQLEKISVSSRELVDNLQDIIWVLNPRNDTLESLAAYIREYALKYFEPLDVKIAFNYPEEFSKQPLSEEKRRNVFLTVKESLHNIAKHAWCNHVYISINENADQFVISIKDDGKGFDTEQARLFANGLKNMQNRIEQAGGIFSVQSEPGKGTLTVMTMPV
jgi:signal transduction histidine kinase